MTSSKSRSKKSLIIATSVLVGVGALSGFQLLRARPAHNSGSGTSPASVGTSGGATLSVPVPAASPSSSLVSSVSSSDRLEAFIAEESRRVAQVDPDPARTEARLAQYAKDLSVEDLQILAKKSISPALPGDERFLSVYLLARNGSTASQGLLAEVAGSALPDHSPDSPLHAQELAIRAQALEGFGQFAQDPSAQKRLAELTDQLRDGFLAERARRVLAAMRDPEHIQDISAQDRAALEKVLQK